jgi:hypothetical protein
LGVRESLACAPDNHHARSVRSPLSGAVVRDRNAPQKHVWRAEIILFPAAGLGTVEIMRRTGTAKTSVWRWQERFMLKGVAGLLRDKTRPSRVKQLGQEMIEQWWR